MASSSSDSEDGPPPLAARIGLDDQDHSPDGNARDAYVFVPQSAKHEETAAWLRAQLSLSRSMSETVAEVSKTITPACKNEFFESIRA